MFAILRRRNFALLWFGQLISIIGDWVLFIALPFYVYNMTGSALATGSMFAAQLLPSLLLGSVAGVFVDRWNRKRVMIASDALRGLVLLLLLVVRSPEQLWVVYLVAIAQSTLGQFFVPAKNAIIPVLVDEHELIGANSLNAVSDSVTRLIGPSLGGVLMAWLGLTSVVLVDSASFFISALMIALIALPKVVSQPAAVEVATRFGVAWRRFAQEWLEGLRLIRKDRVLSGLFAVMGISALADAILSGIFVVLVTQLLHGTAQELGWLMAGQGVGGLIGGLLISRMSERLGTVRMVALGFLTIGVLDPLLFVSQSVPVAFLLIVPIGFTIVGSMVGLNTLLQSNSRDEFRGRVFGALFTSGSLMRLIGIVFGSLLADAIGVIPPLWIGGLLWVAGGVLAWLLLPISHQETRALGAAERVPAEPSL
ncbi:MAG: MFS transporter [Chloroflexi bacterium]|nr:MAG: MFS transporter [Chloroflexota bacterium]